MWGPLVVVHAILHIGHSAPQREVRTQEGHPGSEAHRTIVWDAAAGWVDHASKMPARKRPTPVGRPVSSRASTAILTCHPAAY